MNKEMDGKLIAWVIWPDGSKLTASDDVGIHFRATYHGDRSEFWIVESNSQGYEVRMHNTRTVDSWEWVEPIVPDHNADGYGPAHDL